MEFSVNIILFSYLFLKPFFLNSDHLDTVDVILKLTKDFFQPVNLNFMHIGYYLSDTKEKLVRHVYGE